MSENDVSPKLVLELVAKDVPTELHDNLLIAESLAAAYHHRERLQRDVIRTKDADVVVQPAGALKECQEIARRLLACGWQPMKDLCWPCKSPSPVDALRVIRLSPPKSALYFVELLGLPVFGQREPKWMAPCELDDGWYCVPCFKYMAVLAEDRRTSHAGIQHASPAMMALANLLAHPEVGASTIAETSILRGAKDLGRVLVLSILEPELDLEQWGELWWYALRKHFPSEARVLSERVGSGIRSLLGDSKALDQAVTLAETGLLFGKGIGHDQLRIAGERLLAGSVADLVRLANEV
jgi:hypothetical protein